MKSIYFIPLFFIFSCAMLNKNKHPEDLVGKITVNDIRTSAAHQHWFDSAYKAYEIRPKLTKRLKDSIDANDIKIEIFIGTWCPDTRRYLPRFIKILDTMKFTNYTLYGLNRKKKSKEKFEKDKNITAVPTFIVYKNEEMVALMIERPRVIFEQDILAALINHYHRNKHQNKN